jgi:phosphatidylserine/phosphatidylglycerophosphate/cardiolipin synthase-like enzyme
MAGSTGTRMNSASRGAETRVSGAATRVLFSPKGGTSKELARLIKAAKKEIVVAVYAFSSKYLGQALSAALKRGIKIRVLLDGGNARKAYSIDEWLACEGIDVRFIEIKRGSLHHKFMLIDARSITTGSYNFTNESEFRNYEAAIFTNNKALIQAFAAEFERLWKLCTPAASAATLPSDGEATAPPVARKSIAGTVRMTGKKRSAKSADSRYRRPRKAFTGSVMARKMQTQEANMCR